MGSARRAGGGGGEGLGKVPSKALPPGPVPQPPYDQLCLGGGPATVSDHGQVPEQVQTLAPNPQPPRVLLLAPPLTDQPLQWTLLPFSSNPYQSPPTHETSWAPTALGETPDLSLALACFTSGLISGYSVNACLAFKPPLLHMLFPQPECPEFLHILPDSSKGQPWGIRKPASLLPHVLTTGTLCSCLRSAC